MLRFRIWICCVVVVLGAGSLSAQPAPQPARVIETNEAIQEITYSPDGKVIAGGTLIGQEVATVYLWDAQTGAEITSFHPKKSVTSFAFTADNKNLVVGESRGAEFHMWNLGTQKPVVTFEGHDSSALAISPDGAILASGHGSNPMGRLMLWNLNTGEQIARVKLGHFNGKVNGVAFTPDGKNVAVVGDTMLRLINVESHEKVFEIESVDVDPKMKALPDWGMDVAFSSDGKLAATGNRNNKARIWDVAKRELIREFPHPSDLHFVRFTAGNQRIVTVCRRVMKLWDVTTGENLMTITPPKRTPNSLVPGSFTCASLSPNGKAFAGYSATRKIMIYPIAAAGDGQGESTAKLEEPADEPAKVEEAIPRYKVLSHELVGQRVNAKVLVEASGGKTPTEGQLEAIWRELNGKTDKVVALSFYVIGMETNRPAWSVAVPDEKEGASIRKFDSRLPEQFRAAE